LLDQHRGPERQDEVADRELRFLLARTFHR
jgi:hypothetical protein